MQVVTTPTVILNNAVYIYIYIYTYTEYNITSNSDVHMTTGRITRYLYTNIPYKLTIFIMNIPS